MYAELYLEGNGAASLAWLGALGAIMAAGGISAAPRVACYSMGSLIAAGLALGATPDRILDVVCASPLAGATSASLVLRMLTWRYTSIFFLTFCCAGGLFLAQQVGRCRSRYSPNFDGAPHRGISK